MKAALLDSGISPTWCLDQERLGIPWAHPPNDFYCLATGVPCEIEMCQLRPASYYDVQDPQSSEVHHDEELQWINEAKN